MTIRVHLTEDRRPFDAGDVDTPCYTSCVLAIAYLGGPMRGIPEFNFPAFHAAASDLRLAGWTIHSPAEQDEAMGLDGKDYPTGDEAAVSVQGYKLSESLVWDFSRIMESSCVIFLPGWERSTGSHWEQVVAYATGKPIFEYHGAHDLRAIEPPAVVTQPTKCGLRYEATTVAEPPIEPKLISDREVAAVWFQAGLDQGYALGRADETQAFLGMTPEDLESLERFREAPKDDDVDRWEATREDEAFDAGWHDAEALAEARTRLDAPSEPTGPSLDTFQGIRFIDTPRSPEQTAEDERLRRLVQAPVQPGDWGHPDLQIELVEYGPTVLTTPMLTGETRIVDPETGGAKGQKECRMGALDPVALEQMGLVAGMGEQKYDRFNFLKGYAWSLSVDAMFRHILLFLMGEDLDEESHLPHMAHAAWHAHALTGFLVRGIGTDDRAPRSK